MSPDTSPCSTSLKIGCAVLVALLAAWHGDARGAIGAQETGAWSLVYGHFLPGKYEDFAWPDAKHGWLVHAVGEILQTSDGGDTWTVQATGKGRLRSIDFLDTRRGFAGTINGVLWGTSDGGATWTDITATLPRPTLGFCGITHTGERVHIVGKYTGGAADYYVSPDGGKTWSVTSLKDLAYGLVDVMFLDQSVGFIGGMAPAEKAGVGPALILKTTDGGKSWKPVFTHDGGRGFAWKLFPLSAKVIYASLQSQDGIYRVAKTVDGGDTWTVQIVATGRPTGPGIQGIGFLDENTGWVGGFFAGMYGTTDGGQTWTPGSPADMTINRFERVGARLFTASTRGVLRYERPAPRK